MLISAYTFSSLQAHTIIAGLADLIEAGEVFRSFLSDGIFKIPYFTEKSIGSKPLLTVLIQVLSDSPQLLTNHLHEIIWSYDTNSAKAKAM